LNQQISYAEEVQIKTKNSLTGARFWSTLRKCVSEAVEHTRFCVLELGATWDKRYWHENEILQD